MGLVLEVLLKLQKEIIGILLQSFVIQLLKWIVNLIFLNFTIKTSNPNLKAYLYLHDRNQTLQGHDWDKVYNIWQTNKSYDCNNLTSGFLQKRDIISDKPGSFTPISNMVPYFWFLVVADCSASSINVESFDVSFTNPYYGKWEQQFSFDRWGIGQTYIAFFIFYIVLVALHLWGCYSLYRVEAYHPIVKLLTGAILFGFFDVFFQMIHYSIFAGDGVGAPFLESLGNLLTMGSNLLLMFLCILVAKGWAITTQYLSQKNFVLIFMSLFILFYIFLFIWDNFARDPALTLYFYESVPGVIVLFIRTVIVVWFIWCLRNTLRLENLPQRRQFYQIFGISYMIWFLALPLSVLICSAIDPWYRFKIVRGLSIVIDFVGFGALAYLLWPSRASTYFTIRTTSQLLDEDKETDQI